MKVLDLGSAPGGWSRSTLEIIKKGQGKLVAVDKVPMELIADSEFLLMDVMSSESTQEIKKHSTEFDVILSDMMLSETKGSAFLETLELNFKVFHLAREILKTEGSMLFRMMISNGEEEYFESVKPYFSELIRLDSYSGGRRNLYYCGIGWKNNTL